jgi:hypothetical protein
MSALVTKEAYQLGLIEDLEIQEIIDPKDSDVVMDHAAVLLATNAKLKEVKARLELGWIALDTDFLPELSKAVQNEAMIMELRQAK